MKPSVSARAHALAADEARTLGGAAGGDVLPIDLVLATGLVTGNLGGDLSRTPTRTCQPTERHTRTTHVAGDVPRLASALSAIGIAWQKREISNATPPSSPAATRRCSALSSCERVSDSA